MDRKVGTGFTPRHHKMEKEERDGRRTGEDLRHPTGTETGKEKERVRTVLFYSQTQINLTTTHNLKGSCICLFLNKKGNEAAFNSNVYWKQEKEPILLLSAISKHEQ